MADPKANNKKRRVLLVGWDGADWDHIDPLLEKGWMPTLNGIIENGVMANLATMKPVLSPMLWNTIATGKLPDQHGIHGFMEPDPSRRSARPVTSLSRKVKAIWNILSQVGLKSNVISWWASHPAEPINGTVVTNNFVHIKRQKGGLQVADGTIHPAERIADLARFKVFPDELTDQDLLPFIPEAARIDQTKDKRLLQCATVLSHCASVQAVATAIMHDDDWDFTAIYFDAIDHFCHSFMPFAPPQMNGISDEDFLIYKEVINSAYRFHDMMLKAVCDLAGEDATVIVCSDHGFLSGSKRPTFISREPAGPADWHRDHGILAIKGPGIKKDERIYGAGIIDITPTLLSIFGLPIGEDMRGRPLTAAFVSPPAIETIPSWDEVPGNSGMHPADRELAAEDAEELRKQFVALGYVEDHGDDRAKAHDAAQVEMEYNLARVFVSTRRPESALPYLLSLIQKRPWEERFIVHLARCLFDCGYFHHVKSLLDEAFPDRRVMPPVMTLLLARTMLHLGDVEEANRLQDVLNRADRVSADVYIELGHMNLRRQDNVAAESAFNRALELDPGRATAHEGLARAALRQHRNEYAADAALSAVSLLHHLPGAHFTLGAALARLGVFDRAAQAFETALQMRPSMIKAHRWLARIYGSKLGDSKRKEYHLNAYHSGTAARVREQEHANSPTEFDIAIPPIPSPQERLDFLNQERPLPKPKAPPGSSGRTLLVVSGLPRSGTSLMMQMLEAGGISAMTDGKRTADVDNPKGYYEWEQIKEVGKKPEILDNTELDDKAIKVISMLLPALPAEHNYKITFMMRPTEEVAKSQKKMIDRLGTEGAKADETEIATHLDRHRANILGWLRTQDNIDVLEIDYPSLVSDPNDFIDRIVKFIGPDQLPNRDAMASVVRPDLHRQKT